MAASQRIEAFTDEDKAHQRARHLQRYAHRTMLSWTEGDGRHCVGPLNVATMERVVAVATKAHPAFSYWTGGGMVVGPEVAEIMLSNARMGMTT